jgi:hypothetical protein
LVDFFVFELGDSLVGSVVVDSLSSDFSVFASDFLVLLFEVLFGLVARSAAGLVEVAGALLVGAGDFVPSTLGFGLTLGFAVEAGVVVAATEAVAAGLALALVEADVLVVVFGAVVVVVPVLVVPLVVEALTPNVVGTLTP